MKPLSLVTLGRFQLKTARKWMHELGFEVVAKKKAKFVDGHECPDVTGWPWAFKLV